MFLFVLEHICVGFKLFYFYFCLIKYSNNTERFIEAHTENEFLEIIFSYKNNSLAGIIYLFHIKVSANSYQLKKKCKLWSFMFMEGFNDANYTRKQGIIFYFSININDGWSNFIIWFWF